MIRLAADTVNGVYTTTEPVTMEGEKIFYASLRDLTIEDGVMICEVSEELAAKIKAEYGIN